MGLAISILGLLIAVAGGIAAFAPLPGVASQAIVQGLLLVAATIGVAIFGIGLCASHLGDIADALRQPK